MNLEDRPASADLRGPLAARLGALRPRLHRYLARMTGSVIDGEDVLQDAFLRATEGVAEAGEISNLDGWIFRIAHHAALDFLRKRKRREVEMADHDLERVVDGEADAAARVVVAARLSAFMHLPLAQRSAVILMDVLGHSLEEIADISGSTVPAVKAALHRGRGRLRDLADDEDDLPVPILSATEGALLARYARLLNARDFAGLRDMLADSVRVEVVARATLNGKAAISETYFGNYADTHDWLCVPGSVEGRPALLVHHRQRPQEPPCYFILTTWEQGRLVQARDFRHAQYAADGAQMRAL